MRKINRIVVHYTATYADRALTISEVERWHVARGFKEIGYHFLVHQDGRIDRGRDVTKVGAHVKGHNVGSIGIAFVGGLYASTGANKGHDTRTPQQKAALLDLLKRLIAEHPVDDICGHKDLQPTQCPAFDVRAEYAYLVEAKR